MYRNFVAKSPQMLDIISVVTKIAPTNSPVLIHGENGVGKSLVAEQIHLKSLRRNDLFVRVNCFSKSNQLLESEIFGDDSSNQKNEGSLKLSSKGTIFFDEIGYLPLNLQKKLLDYIQNGECFSRIVASTSVDLESKVSDGSFLRELYYRLNTLPIKIPALRYRKEDIEPLAMNFCEIFGKKLKKNFTGFTQNALEMLYDYYWQGNVRELKNAIERACILGQPPIIQVGDLCLGVRKEDVFDSQVIESSSDKTLKTALHYFKKNYVVHILDSVSWNQTEAAKIMGIQRTYLSKLMSDLDIRK
jgi:Nif-specific regulatory protein